MEPTHSLSEILNRRLRHLGRYLEKAKEHDTITACLEEIKSIEYHLRIVEEAERSVRFENLFETITNIAEDYNAKLLGRN